MTKISELFLENDIVKYISMAYDNQHYYLLIADGNGVMKLDETGNTIDYFPLEMAISGLCYDNTSQCFWAVTNQANNIVYKFNCQLKLISNLNFENFGLHGCIKSLSHNICKDSLIFAFGNAIVAVKKLNASSRLINRNRCFNYDTISSLCPYYLTTSNVLNNFNRSEKCVNCEDSKNFCTNDADTFFKQDLKSACESYDKEQYFMLIDEHGQVLDRQKFKLNGNVISIVFNAKASKARGCNVFSVLLNENNRNKIVISSLTYGNLSTCSCINGIINPCKNKECCCDESNVCTCDVDGGNL